MNFKSIFAVLPVALLTVTLYAMEKPTLMKLIENVDLEGIDDILNCKLDEKSIVVNNNTPLHLAALNDYKPIMRRLLENKNVAKYINFKNSEGLTPLHCACINNHSREIELLLEKNASINCSDNEDKKPLHFVSANGNLQSADLLLQKGACINDVDKKKLTPLHYSVNNNHDKMVKLLVEKGAITNCKDINQYTPLHMAASKGYVSIAKTLLDHGASILESANNWTVLDCAIDKNHYEIIKLFLEKGHFSSYLEKVAFINCTDSKGRTSLHTAAVKGYTDIVKILLEHGAYPAHKNNSGQTAAALAREKGNYISLTAAELIEAEQKKRIQKMEEKEKEYIRVKQENEKMCKEKLKEANDVRLVNAMNSEKNFDFSSGSLIAVKRENTKVQK